MKNSLNLKSVQNFASQFIVGRDLHQQLRQYAAPVNYPVRTMNFRDPVDDTRNYYKILGVEKSSSHSDIKNAYYHLAKQYHPDNRRGGKLEKQFNEIAEAYNVLIDSNKRAEYNKYGKINDIQGYMKLIGERDRAKNENERIKLKELLQKDLPILKLGAPAVNPSFRSGEASISIDFLHSVQGLKRDFLLKVFRKCPRCCGTYSHKSETEKCKKCDGVGVFMVQTKTSPTSKSCDLCNGKCVTQKNTCAMCENKGFLYENQSVYIAIPPGIVSGDVIQIMDPNSEKRIAVKVNVKNSNKFERKGSDIYTDLLVSIPDVILGAKFKVQTIHGLVELRIPPGAESHSTVILHGKGVRTPKVLGDHIVTLKVEIPKVINESVRKVLSLWDLEMKKKIQKDK